MGLPAALLLLTLSFAPLQAGENVKSKFLEPADMIRMMTESKTTYEINPLDKLDEETRKHMLETLYPEAAPYIAYPLVKRNGKGEASIRQFPFHPKAWELIQLAETPYQEEKYDEAMILYQKAVEISPDCYLAYHYLGECYQFQGNSPKAIECYDKALKINPYDYQVYYFKGECLLLAGQGDEAMKNLIHALALKPRHENIMIVLRKVADRVGFKLQEDIFRPRCLVRRASEKGAVQIYVDTEGPGKDWMIYAIGKALWLGEPKHRQELTGKKDVVWSTTEERECVAALLAAYLHGVEKKGEPKVAEFERLAEILKEGYFNEMLQYEIGSRVYPNIMTMQPAESVARMEEYIKRYVVVMPGGKPAEK